MKSSFRKVGQRGLFDFSSKQQLTSWTILHNLYTIWLLNKKNLYPVELQAMRDVS